MNIGWVGLGKLGLPCALSLAHHGHQVYGYDTNPDIDVYVAQAKVPYVEEKVSEYLADTPLQLADSVAEAVERSDIIFLAVQTPHAPQFEGNHPIVDDPQDFEYQYLVNAYREIVDTKDHKTVVVVSTVLPGTFDRLLRPITPPNIFPVYNPFFIAMGTTIPDFENPEFVLTGSDNPDAARRVLKQVYGPVHDRPFHTVSIPTAELLKVAYNTYIGQKIVFGNTMMEIAHKTGADCDDLIEGLALATDRIISPKYLRGGMGDGGGCHPRDNIAMSWLAQRLDLSYDLFGQVTKAREAQTGWLARMVEEFAELADMPIVMMGEAFKAGTNLTVGSPATLLSDLFEEAHAIYDPVVYPDMLWAPEFPAVYVISTNHPEFAEYEWPAGSIVIDPWGYIPDRPQITVIPVGRK
jgi:UDPglucose 6-dehydrogenase